ncbi:hypothetical protein FACS1894145_5840 [Bacteroidia bacterium]|nr:hypothetical protein FACS1894145_5840 [Bacteroidia bacterium]
MKINEAQRLLRSFFEKEKLYRNKLFRSRKDSSIEYNRRKREIYSNLYKRASNLVYRLDRLERGKDIIDYTDKIFIQGEYEATLKRKAERKEQFLSLHRYSKWYMSDSLGADYGLFKCDKCGYEFYHSPSTISLAGKTVYNCCCGYCTNTIIYNDYRKKIYS